MTSANIVETRLNQTVIWHDPSLLSSDEAALEGLFDIAYWQQKQAVLGSAKGRGTTWFVQGQLPMALRHYYRGGLFGKLVRDQYLFHGWQQTRCYQEFALLAQLRALNIPVPRPVAARVQRCGVFYRADILVERIEGAQDLVATLQAQPLTPEVYQQIGRLVRQLHDAGICHTDLNIHNILQDQSGRLWLIDFDKCGSKQGEGWKADNLARLQRSFIKEQKKTTNPLAT
ncbi:3-deoxy-D-manno-octulosonic acid kinase [Vibrio stylophorae]|uniref:3-deoxy-D-manno-octulosonic acid kinase n=1 Tax=Vibrio stylophorae TaxID=659351 RepID=A0ABM8ZWF4_9VIBR|nr:3-deoxy-D-manno-octulosonic acid kinase [Vibrio stylophorae]